MVIKIDQLLHKLRNGESPDIIAEHLEKRVTLPTYAGTQVIKQAAHYPVLLSDGRLAARSEGGGYGH